MRVNPDIRRLECGRAHALRTGGVGHFRSVTFRSIHFLRFNASIFLLHFFTVHVHLQVQLYVAVFLNNCISEQYREVGLNMDGPFWLAWRHL